MATQQLLNGVMGTQAEENNTCYVVKFRDRSKQDQTEKVGRKKQNYVTLGPCSHIFYNQSKDKDFILNG